VKRSARFNMVMMPEERAMLQALADERGVTESDVLRMYVREQYAEKFGKKKPGAPEPKYNSRAAIAAAKKATK
jgi:hypothetical protein